MSMSAVYEQFELYKRIANFQNVDPKQGLVVAIDESLSIFICQPKRDQGDVTVALIQSLPSPGEENDFRHIQMPGKLAQMMFEKNRDIIGAIKHQQEKIGAAYKQECKKCNIACTPYRVEKLICSVCGNRDCICTKEDRKKRNIDANKPHRSDLCEKCKAGLPCQ